MTSIHFKIAQGFLNAKQGAQEVAGAAQVSQSSLEAYVANIVGVALTIIGTLFFLLVVYGGYIWMIARGNEKEADRAKDIITTASIGLVIVVIAYALSSFVVKSLVGAI